MKATINLFLMLMNDKGILALASAHTYTAVKQEVRDDCLGVSELMGEFKKKSINRNLL